MRPKVGCTERNQPATSPAISAPPAVDRVNRDSGHIPHKCADQRTNGDSGADKCYVRNISCPSGNTKQIGHDGGVLCAADNVENVAAKDFRVAQDRDGGRNCAPCDFPQEDAARSG